MIEETLTLEAKNIEVNTIESNVVKSTGKKSKEKIAKSAWPIPKPIVGPIEVKFKKNHPNAKPPHREKGNNGFDLVVVDNGDFALEDVFQLKKHIYSVEDAQSKELRFTLKPGQRHKFSTGLSVQLPEKHFILIRPRSGNAVRHGIHVLGGLVDENYRGPLDVILLNTSDQDVVIVPGDRIAQFVIIKDDDYQMIEVDELDDTNRGEKGFGSSGR